MEIVINGAIFKEGKELYNTRIKRTLVCKKVLANHNKVTLFFIYPTISETQYFAIDSRDLEDRIHKGIFRNDIPKK